MNLQHAGFDILHELIAPEVSSALLEQLSALRLQPLRGGIRRIEQQLPAVEVLAKSARLLELVRPYLDGEPKLVRAIYFEKSPQNNWYVTWHQDKTVSVSHRFEAEGWKAWSLKAGAWHTQPPLAVLENMVTIRIHLDPATRQNGCLKVIPRSHLSGLLKPAEIQSQVGQSQPDYCEVPAGGAVMMRPLILHASEKAINDTPRRVLHFEYSGYALPEGIAWTA